MEEVNQLVSLPRKQLYEEIWSITALGVAKKYGLSYQLLLKECHAKNIAIPPSGYWTKKNLGMPVEELPFSGDADEAVNLQIAGARTKRNKIKNVALQGKKAGTESKKNDQNVAKKKEITKAEQIALPEEEPGQMKHELMVNKTEESVQPSAIKNCKLIFLNEAERKAVLDAAQQVCLPTANMTPLRKLTAHKAIVKEWNKKNNRPEGSSKSLKDFSSKNPPFLAGVISEEALPRILRILDAIYRQIEVLDGTINKDLSLKIPGSWYPLLFLKGRMRFRM